MKKSTFILCIGILSATFSLFIGVSFAEAQLVAPTSPSPSDGATAEQPVILKWSSVEFPADIPGGYLLEVAGGNLPSGLTRWAETNSYDLTRITQTLLAGREHRWRVRACFGFDVPANPEEACGPWSNNGILWKFTPTLAKPELIFPKNNDVASPDAQGQITLQWKVVAGAERYKVTLQKISGTLFTTTFEKTEKGNIIGTSFLVPKQWLILNNFYKWKVSGVAAGKDGPASDEAQFFFAAFPKPVLETPADGTAQPYPVLFSWKQVSGAKSYVLEVFDSANKKVVQKFVPGTSFLEPLGDTKIGERYSWRVTACEAQNNNCGPPSARFNFTLVYAAPTIVVPTPNQQVTSFPLALQWTKPAGPLALDFKYTWEIKKDNETVLSGEKLNLNTDEISKPLAPGNYTLRVRACNQASIGCSEWSKDAAFQVPSSVPTVVPSQPALIVSPSGATIPVGTSEPFQALFDPDGSGPQPRENKTGQTQWSSSNTSVATVETGDTGDPGDAGAAACKSKGTTTITATLPGFSADATLICSAAPAAVSSISGVLEVTSEVPPIQFVPVQPGEKSIRNRALVLLNVSSSSVTAALSVSGEGFSVVPSSITLSPEQDQGVHLVFLAPSKAGRYEGTVTVNANVGTTSVGSRSVALLASVEIPAPAGVSGGPSAGPGAPSGTAKTISDVADRAANVAFTALLIAASLFVLLAAFQFVTGGGNPEAISQARDKLIWAAAGIGIALVSKGVAVILQNILLGPPGEPDKGPCPSPAPVVGKVVEGIQNPLNTICFSGILYSILNVIFTLSLIVVPFVVLYAGFLFVTGGGNPEQITRARNTLIWTAVGFGVILIAKGLPFILKDILGI